jgi:Protein of unknown function (DUF3606)
LPQVVNLRRRTVLSAEQDEEVEMPDDKTNRGAQDRARVASEEQYEVDYFAQKHGITAAAAREIIELSGPSREKADAAVHRAQPKPQQTGAHRH